MSGLRDAVRRQVVPVKGTRYGRRLFVTFTLAETLRPSGSAVKWLLRSGGVTDRCGYAEASAFPDPHYKGKKEI